MSASAAIEAGALSRRFGLREALRGVSLRVEWGERVAVFGPNGAGKTTLVRVLSTVLRPSAGQLRLAGLDPQERPRQARALLGLLAEGPGLYEELSVRENLAFFCGLYRRQPEAARLEALLEGLGIGERADEPVRALSRGLRQRAALARALAHAPRILLLDEPFQGLDREGCERLERLLRQFTAGGGALVFTGHEIETGLALATRWVVLRQGARIAEGTSTDTSAETIVALCGADR